MPPLAAPVSVIDVPLVIEVALIVELFVSSAELTVTVNVLLAIVPSASLTLIRTV